MRMCIGKTLGEYFFAREILSRACYWVLLCEYQIVARNTEVKFFLANKPLPVFSNRMEKKMENAQDLL